MAQKNLDVDHVMQVVNQFNDEPITDEELGVAREALTRMAGATLSEDNVKFYVAMRRSGMKRVYADSLKKVDEVYKKKKSTAAVKKYWCVYKSRYPNLGADLEKWFPGRGHVYLVADPSTVPDLDEELVDKIWVVDHCVPEVWLGPGTWEHIIKEGKGTKSVIQPRVAIEPPASGKEAPVETASGNSIVPSNSAALAVSSTQEKIRPLERHGSATDDDTAKLIADRAKAHGHAGRIYSSDKSRSDTVDFCIVELKAYLKTIVDDYVKEHGSMEGVAKAIPTQAFTLLHDIIANVVLQHKCYKHIKVFADHIREFDKLLPDVVSKMCSALVRLEECGDSADASSIIQGMKLAHSDFFTHCPLYFDWQYAKFTKEFLSVKQNSNVEIGKRHETIKNLKDNVPQDCDAEIPRQLSLAEVMTSNGSPKTKVEHILANPTCFDDLEEWFPKQTVKEFENYYLLRMAASSTIRFQDYSFSEFKRLLNLLIYSKAENIKNADVKSVIEDYARMTKAVEDVQGIEPILLLDLCVELASIKLPLQGVPEKSATLNVGDEGIAKAGKLLIKVIGPLRARKFTDASTIAGALIASVAAKQPPKAETSMEADKNPSAVASIEVDKNASGKPAAEGGTKEGSDGKQPSVEGEPVAEDGTQVGSDGNQPKDEFVQGAQVRVSFGNQKDRYDNKLAVITKVLAKDCWVEYTEGPAGEVKEQKKIKKVNLTLVAATDSKEVVCASDSKKEEKKDNAEKLFPGGIGFE